MIMKEVKKKRNNTEVVLVTGRCGRAVRCVKTEIGRPYKPSEGFGESKSCAIEFENYICRQLA